MVKHLYIHIPFCAKICPYCCFYKETIQQDKMEAFVTALLKELESRASLLAPETIFFGGGTPTILTAPQLERLCKGMAKHIDLSKLREWTVEINPVTMTPEKASCLQAHGVNRVSMGVQSWDPEFLKLLGRAHTAKQALDSYHELRRLQFKNINLDLMFSLPGQTLDHWQQTLEFTAQLKPEHISTYCLTYEEDTAFFQRFQSGEFTRNEEEEAAFFSATQTQLANHGYEQYEVSNYSLPDLPCHHNLAYWKGTDYLGLGPSAFSTIGDHRWRNIADTTAYIQRINTDIPLIDFEEHLSPQTRLAEKIAFGLRTNQGIPIATLPTPEKLESLRNNQLITIKNNHCRLTPRGLLLADSIASSLLEFDW